MTVVPVTQGHRYAIGVRVPLAMMFIPNSPLSQLKKDAEAQGMATVSDPAAASFLADLGWSEVTAYEAGRAPMVEPLSDHEFVILATRSGAGESIDTDAPQWGTALRWIEETNVLPGVQPRPPTEGAAIPWMPIAVAVGLLAGGALLVAAFAEDR